MRRSSRGRLMAVPLMANLAVDGITNRPKSGIPKRKKTATHNRPSCKVEYLLRLNHGDGSIASEFFTGD